MSPCEELCSDRVEGAGVVLEQFAARVNDDVRLIWVASLVVILQRVVGEVVEDFKREEVAGRGDVLVPVEDGAIDDLDFV